MSHPRIFTRCPSCGNDTLCINEGHLLCTWHDCKDPCAIERNYPADVALINARESLHTAVRLKLAAQKRLERVQDLVESLYDAAAVRDEKPDAAVALRAVLDLMREA